MFPIHHCRTFYKTHCPECKYPFDLTQMSIAISKAMNREGEDHIRTLKYGYPTQYSTDINKLSVLQWFINSLKSGRTYEDCIEECEIQAILENINTQFPPSSHTICRNDLIIDETNRDSWNSSNPACVSRYEWEKLKYAYCDLEYHIEIAVQQCDLNFTPVLDIQDCEISYQALVSQYDCDLTFEQYTQLLNCNLTHEAISYIYSCDLNIVPGATIQDCQIRTGDGTLLDLGEVIE